MSKSINLERVEEMQVLYSYLNKDRHNILLETYLSGFSKTLQHKIRAYYQWEDAQASLLGRLLLFKGVEIYNKHYTEIDIDYNDYQKPFFADQQLKFNISHSGELVVCVLSKTLELGIDVEMIKEVPLESFRSQMTPTEWKKVVAASNKLEAFYDYWTAKEAVIKAHGNGLSLPLRSFEIIHSKTEIAGETYYIKEVFLNNKYKSFIASNSPSLNVEEIEFQRIDF